MWSFRLAPSSGPPLKLHHTGAFFFTPPLHLFRLLNRNESDLFIKEKASKIVALLLTYDTTKTEENRKKPIS